jgi:formylglycine-generating enzyme required for sulfatase activity
VVERKRLTGADIDPGFTTTEPISIQGVGEFTPQELQPPTSEPQAALAPLIRWPRLWPFLKRASSVQFAGPIDIPRLADQIASGKLFYQFPRKRQLHWSLELIVLLDFNSRTLPFWDDFNQLCETLAALRGSIGLNIRKLGRIPGGNYTHWRQPSARSEPWQMPPPGTPILILSDLGMLDKSESVTRRHWLRFGHQLKAAGIVPFVLAPVSPQHINPELSRYYHISLWDRNSRLLRQRQRCEQDSQKHIEQLLALLSPAIRIEPELLRAVRYLLPADSFDAGCEAEFWQHPDVQVSPVACSIRPEAIEKYRAEFRHQSAELQWQIIELIRQHHAHLFPAVRHEEMLIWASLISHELANEFRTDIEQAETFMRKMARMLYQQREKPDASRQAYGIRHLDRSHTDLRNQNLYYSVVEGVVNRDKLDSGVPVRAGIDRDELRRTLSSGSQQIRHCTLYQHGHELIIAEKDPSRTTEIQPGSRYADLIFTDDGLFVQQELEEASQPEYYLQLTDLPKPLAMLTQDTRNIRLQTNTETLTLSGFTKPDWATRLGRDPHGLYADLEIKGVTQRFRWIVPGTFLMGSPKDETERSDDETQHPVTLTQGYWMADKACTQALWRAVMGENPAYFKDNVNNPVEQVSWNDVQEFIIRLNNLVPELEARLPTEAQWEYACRAGTTTPFSFGENITPEQVNYDGNYPYANGEKGLSRGKTIPVKSLPPNPWGLYEMHGNVWEWCYDWYGDYPSEPVVDPVEPSTGATRVLRGGSGGSIGGGVHSASRHGGGPGYRGSIGFRLSLGQVASTRQVNGRREGASEAGADKRK